MKALLIKEFRENSKWLVVGLVLFAGVAYCWLPEIRFTWSYSFVSSFEKSLTAIVGFLGGLFALSLGVLQSALDLRSGPRAYLQHRGVKSSQIVLAKLITGFTIYAIAILIPMSLLAVYLGGFGIQTIPVRPYQIVRALAAGFFAYIMHPAAILCLSRGASWWGTKTIPIFAALAIAGSMIVYCTVTSDWLWLFPVYMLLLAITCWAAVDAWEKLSLNPPAAQSLPNGWRVNGVLFLGSLACTLIALQLLSPLGSLLHRTERREFETKFDLSTGEPWAVSTRPEDLLKSNVEKSNGSIFGSKIQIGVVPNEFSFMPKKMQLGSMQYLTDDPDPSTMFQSLYSDQYNYWNHPIWANVIDRRGYLLRYSVIDRERPRLDSIIDKEGIHSPNSLPDKPFVNLREILNGPSGFRAYFDSKGVYALQRYRSNAPDVLLNRLVEGNVSAAELSTIPILDVHRLVVVVDGEVREYQLLDENDSEEWTTDAQTVTIDDNGTKTLSRKGEEQAIRAKLIQSVALPVQFANRKPHSLLRTQAGYVVMVDSFSPKYFLLKFDGTSEELPVPKDESSSNALANPVNATLPPALMLIASFAHFIYWANRGESAELVEWLMERKSILVYLAILGIIFVLASVWVVNRMLRKRGIAGKLRWAWLLTCIPLGIATPLVVASIYAVRVREKCMSCGQPRSVDLEHCEVCNTQWPLGELEGIEVFDTNASLQSESLLST